MSIGKNWWKILAVVLMFYTILAGLLVPLKTGIYDVQSDKITSDNLLQLHVIGYNSHYKAYQNPRAWLRLDSAKGIVSTMIKVEDDRNLTVVFKLPALAITNDTIRNATLILSDSADDVSLIPASVFIDTRLINQNIAELPTEKWNNPIVKSDFVRPWRLAFPYRNQLYETIRNLFFHVPMWFTMFALLGLSVWYSVRYLLTNNLAFDIKAKSYTATGTFFGILGMITGSLWARFTWGAWFPWDVKLIMATVAVLIYCAYFVLRSSFEDMEKEARLAAIYSVFAFASLPMLLFIIPRLTDSLHPGNGGNPAFGGQDLDNTMRMVFYPANIGWILLGLWITQLIFRMEFVKDRFYSR